MPALRPSLLHLRKPNLATFAFSALALSLTTMGCASPKPAPDIQPVPEINNIYPTVPANFLICADEPTVPPIATDVDGAKFTEAVRTAGQDCRDRLGKMKSLVAGWPKN